MFYSDWKSFLGPLALYAFGEYNEKKLQDSKQLAKKILTFAAKNDRVGFESFMLLTSADMNEFQKIWEISYMAARELVEFDKNPKAEISHLRALKKICDKIA